MVTKQEAIPFSKGTGNNNLEMHTMLGRWGGGGSGERREGGERTFSHPKPWKGVTQLERSHVLEK